MTSDRHIQAVLAIMKLDIDSHNRYVREFERDGSLNTYEMLLRATLQDTAGRLFGPSATRSSVIRFVASVRKNIPEGAQDFNILDAELLLLACLGLPGAPQQLTTAQGELVGPLCLEVVERLRLDDAQLRETLAAARARITASH